MTSKGSDQTAHMRRLIWGFAGRTYHSVGNLLSRLINMMKIVFLLWHWEQTISHNPYHAGYISVLHSSPIFIKSTRKYPVTSGHYICFKADGCTPRGNGTDKSTNHFCPCIFLALAPEIVTCEKLRRRSACASAQSDQCLCFFTNCKITLSKLAS